LVQIYIGFDLYNSVANSLLATKSSKNEFRDNEGWYGLRGTEPKSLYFYFFLSFFFFLKHRERRMKKKKQKKEEKEKISALFQSISGSSIRHRDLFWTILDSQSPSQSIIGNVEQWRVQWGSLYVRQSVFLSPPYHFCSSVVAAAIHSSFLLGQLVVNQAISNHGHVSDCPACIAITNHNTKLIRCHKKLALIKQFNNIYDSKW